MTVPSLVAKHEGAIRAASPSNSPQQSRTSPTLSRRSLNGEESTSPTPESKELPNLGEGEGDREGDMSAPPPPPASSTGTSGEASSSGTTVLGNIREDSGSLDEKKAEGGEATLAVAEGEGKSKDEAARGEESNSTATPAADSATPAADSAAPAAEVVPEENPGADSPLATMAAQIEQIEEKHREVVKQNLERIAGYPRELPLSCAWTLHFSDTSGASKSSSAAATKDAYTEGISPVFVAKTVPELCGSLKALKKAVRRKNWKPSDPETLGLFRAGQNLHFFRSGISPTWEDPYNEKGGRITISPHATNFDSVYERLVLLCGGASLEIQASELLQAEGSDRGEGMIMGVVASRRARGDRIELWLGGKQKKEPAPMDWINHLRQVLSQELEDPALANAKYKKHF
ncbi:hypothetical protein JCM11641_005339 [Rhodosporidiobolus odoratus]